MDIFTIGHSTHNSQKLIEMLNSFNIKILVDVRSYPGSNFLPHFNQDSMTKWLCEANIQYKHIPELGGRRKKLSDIDPKLIEGWTHTAFRNYAAYSLTNGFTKGLNQLIELSKNNTVCIMCAESVPWKCHRLLISNNLDFKGFDVFHIIDPNKFIKHKINKFGATAVFDGKNVIYPRTD